MSNQAHQNYQDIWATELQNKGWKYRLGHDERSTSESYITLLDISSACHITEWQIRVPAEDEPIQDWIQTHREKLQTLGLNTISRLIVFEEDLCFCAQELLGVEYNIEPAVFRDIVYSRTVRHQPNGWETHDTQLPEYMTEFSPRHLDFGYGWVSKIIATEQSTFSRPKNVGKSLFFRSVSPQQRRS